MVFWIVGAVVVGTVLLAVAFTAYVIIRYMRDILNVFEEGQVFAPPASSHRLEGEEVDFEATDGTPLRGVFLKGNGANGKTVLFCHEYGGDMHSLDKYGGFLLDRGLNVFAFDFRGHGASSETNGYVPRHWVTDKEVKDALGAIEYLKTRPDTNGSALGIFGVSRGAGTSICVAGQCDSIKAVVADSAFSTQLMLEKYMRKWVSIYVDLPVIYHNLPGLFWTVLGFACRRAAERRSKCTYPSVEYSVRRVAPRPMYMIYGEKDNYVGLTQARELFRRAREPKDLWIVPGARHNESAVVANDEYAENVAEFLLRTL